MQVKNVLHTWVSHFNEQIDSVARQAVGGDKSAQLGAHRKRLLYLGRGAPVEPSAQLGTIHCAPRGRDRICVWAAG
eukprot:3894807-Prymnesium_polylepis.1